MNKNEKIEKQYGRAIFWAIFALIVAVLGVLAQFEGEVYFVPLLLGLAVLGLINCFVSMGGGDE